MVAAKVFDPRPMVLSQSHTCTNAPDCGCTACYTPSAASVEALIVRLEAGTAAQQEHAARARLCPDYARALALGICADMGEKRSPPTPGLAGTLKSGNSNQVILRDGELGTMTRLIAEQLMGAPAGYTDPVVTMAGSGSALARAWRMLGMAIPFPIADWLLREVTYPTTRTWRGFGTEFSATSAWPHAGYWMALEHAPQAVLGLARAPIRVPAARVAHLVGPLGPPPSADAASAYLRRLAVGHRTREAAAVLQGRSARSVAPAQPEPLKVALTFNTPAFEPLPAVQYAAAARLRAAAATARAAAGDAVAAASPLPPPAAPPATATAALLCGGGCAACAASPSRRCIKLVAQQHAAAGRRGAEITIAGPLAVGFSFRLAPVADAPLVDVTVKSYHERACTHRVEVATTGAMHSMLLFNAQVELDAQLFRVHVIRARAAADAAHAELAARAAVRPRPVLPPARVSPRTAAEAAAAEAAAVRAAAAQALQTQAAAAAAARAVVQAARRETMRPRAPPEPGRRKQA